MTAELITPVPVFRIGRKKTLHRPRVLIADNQVVVRTRCGLSAGDEGFTETFGFPSCETCIADGAT